ncbi:MAG: PRC-barrel domain-containing protein [Planctomycetaceae bacterium]|nr:PRC-barrel domain-containing protein [Planctomycetaceae bacterium]
MGKTQILRIRSGVLRLSQVLGSPVVSSIGQPLGKIEDCVLDHFQDRVSFAILSLDDFLGVSNKLFAVPLPALSVRAEGGFILHVEPETLKRATGFERNHWPDLTDRNWGEEIYSHYGYLSHWH